MSPTPKSHLSFPPDVLLKAQGAGSGIKAAIFDVDGVLTDGTIWITEHGETLKNFNVLDGQGLLMLRKGGITPIVITGRDSPAVRRRVADLGLAHAAFGANLPQAQRLRPLERVRAVPVAIGRRVHGGPAAHRPRSANVRGFGLCDPAVVLASLNRVGQHVVGHVDDCHHTFGIGVVGVAIRVVLARQAAVRGADFLGRGGARDLEVVVVVVDLGHRVCAAIGDRADLRSCRTHGRTRPRMPHTAAGPRCWHSIGSTAAPGSA